MKLDIKFKTNSNADNNNKITLSKNRLNVPV